MKEIQALSAKIVEREVHEKRLSTQKALLLASCEHIENTIAEYERKKESGKERHKQLIATIGELEAGLEATELAADEAERELALYKSNGLEEKIKKVVKDAHSNRETELMEYVQQELERFRCVKKEEYDQAVEDLGIPERERSLEDAEGKTTELKAQLGRVKSDLNYTRDLVGRRSMETKRLEAEIQKIQRDKEVVTQETDSLKKHGAMLRSNYEVVCKEEDTLRAQVLQKQRDIDEIRIQDNNDKEREYNELKLLVARQKKVLEKLDVNVKGEIDEYNVILNKMEGEFEGKIPKPKVSKQQLREEAVPFNFLPPPEVSTPVAPSIQHRQQHPTPHPVSQRPKKGAKTSKTPSIFTNSVFSPTPKKRKRHDLPSVRIARLDPLFQQVIVENTTDDDIDLTGWKLVNTTLSFTQLFPQNTILRSKGTFTFMPNPTPPAATPKKTKRGSSARKSQADKNKAPVAAKPAAPGTAYWNYNGKELQWPMENASAVLKDAEDNVVDEFILGQKK